MACWSPAATRRLPLSAGNYFARRRFALLQRYLEYLGIEKGRVQFSWVSASEGARFAEVVTRVTEDVRKLGPSRHLNINAAACPMSQR